jgi:hypothetical protein
VREKITSAFKECLETLAEQKNLVLLLDHWEAANDETRRWLQDELLQWVLDGVPPRLVIVVACELQPNWYQRRRDIAPLEIAELPEAAVRLYWIEKKHLPEDKLIGGLSLYGYPALLVMVASELERRLKQDGREAS